MKGTVQIGNQNQVLVSLMYRDRRHRNDILENWKDLYGRRFWMCWINIIPQAEGRITERGLSCRGNEAYYDFDVEKPVEIEKKFICKVV